MTPPINIDGTNENYSSVTIDGQTVEQITIDGQDVLNLIPDSALTEDMVGWWRFEDGDARDYTGDLNATFADSTPYDGTVNGATHQPSGGVTDFDAGTNSGAFDFDGTDDSITRNQIEWSTSNRTIMLWVNLRANNNTQNLFFNQGVKLFFTGSNGYRLLVEGDNGAFNFTNTNVTRINEYVHVTAVVKDNTEVIVYIDGTKSGSDSLSFAASDRNGGKEGFSIGREVNASNDTDTADGLIDDVRIYNRELTSSEISDIFNATKP